MIQFALIPVEVAIEAATILRNEDPENSVAQAIMDWIDINRDPQLANTLMRSDDAHAFHAANQLKN